MSTNGICDFKLPHNLTELFTVYAIAKSEAKHPSTVRNDVNSPLLRLPGELRNRIYEEVFYMGTFTFSARFVTYSKPGPNFFGRPTPEPHLFALLRVCKKIHSETADLNLVLAVNTFSFNLLYRLSAFFVHLTPEQLALISSIDVEVKLGTAHGIKWFVDGWKERGMNSLRDVMPGVRRVYVRFEKVTGIFDSDREEERIEEDEEVIIRWLRGVRPEDVDLTLASDDED